MKKAIGIIILGLVWCSNANAYDCLLTGDNGNYQADLCNEYEFINLITTGVRNSLIEIQLNLELGGSKIHL